MCLLNPIHDGLVPHGRWRAALFGLVAALALGLPTVAQASDGTQPVVSKGAGVDSSGVAPTFLEQTQSWTQAQRDQYAAKIASVERMETTQPSSGARMISANIIATSVPMGTQAQWTWYYCGPATASEMLQPYLYPRQVDQNTLAGQLGTNQNGTNRAPFPGVLGGYESRNAYVWQNLTLDSPNYNQGKADLWNYSYGDLVWSFPPAYNILTMGPWGNLPWYQQHGFAYGHYFPAGGSDTSYNLLIRDPYRLFYEPKSGYDHDYYYYQLVWGVVHNNALRDQVLW